MTSGKIKSMTIVITRKESGGIFKWLTGQGPSVEARNSLLDELQKLPTLASGGYVWYPGCNDHFEHRIDNPHHNQDNQNKSP